MRILKYSSLSLTDPDRRRTIFVTFLFVWASLVSIAAATAPATTWAFPTSTCQALFLAPDSTLGIDWTPYKPSKSQKIPEVLNDPYIQFAIKSDEFRLYLIEENARGRSPISDYKQITDAEPLYPENSGPIVPISPHTKSRLAPHELNFSQLSEYITTNYKLPRKTSDQARFSPQEKVEVHPLMQALKRQGLISSKRPGESHEALIEGALRKLHETWEDLLRFTPTSGRDTLLEMPNKYVVAGGRFRESYFWDSFWIMKGLIESGYGSTARGMLENFVYLFEKHGIIPNGNRYYYLTRSQFPVFMEMVKLLEQNQLLDFTKLRIIRSKLDRTQPSIESRILNTAENYYLKIWKQTDRYRTDFGLFRYSDGAGGSGDPTRIVIRPEAGLLEPRSKELHSQRVFAESGWDMSYSRFGQTPQDYLPVDLNFMLMGYTRHLADLFRKSGDLPKASQFANESNEIRSNIVRYLYDRSTGFFMDYNWVHRKRSEVVTAASFFAFYFGAYKKGESAQYVLKNLFAKLKPEGHLAVHTTDRPGHGQWDGSWAWAPLNEVAFNALSRYGLDREAKTLAFDFSLMALMTFDKNGGKFFEKYRAEDGSITLPKDTEIYGVEEGFGWTNGTIAVFLRHLSETGELPALERELRRRLSPPH